MAGRTGPIADHCNLRKAPAGFLHRCCFRKSASGEPIPRGELASRFLPIAFSVQIRVNTYAHADGRNPACRSARADPRIGGTTEREGNDMADFVRAEWPADSSYTIDGNAHDTATYLAERALAQSTRDAYDRAARAFDDWLGGARETDAALARYLGVLFDRGLAAASAETAVAALKDRARRMGVACPAGERTRQTLCGYRREGAGRGLGQVDGLSWEQADRMAETGGATRRGRSARCAARSDHVGLSAARGRGRGPRRVRHRLRRRLAARARAAQQDGPGGTGRRVLRRRGDGAAGTPVAEGRRASRTGRCSGRSTRRGARRKRG